jgi:hypothetical protein
MSFASILSEPAVEPPKKSPPPTNHQARPSLESNRVASPPPQKTSAKIEETIKSMDRIPKVQEIPRVQIEKPVKSGLNGVVPVKPAAPKKSRKIWSEREVEKITREMEKIDDMEHSDLDIPSFEAAKSEYEQRLAKRTHDVDDAEAHRRKVRISFNYPILSLGAC